MTGQVVVINPDTVDIHGAVVGTDSDVHRGYLREVVVDGVLDNAGDNAIDVAVDQAVLGAFLDDKGDADVLVLFELGADHTLLRRERHALGS